MRVVVKGPSGTILCGRAYNGAAALWRPVHALVRAISGGRPAVVVPVSKGASLLENTVLQQRRPLGITIIAIVLVVTGVLGIILGVFTLMESFSITYHPAMGMRLEFIGVTSIVLGA